ncbi:hypothetical protein K2P97_06515 [bacterium]|nr:hypothetical protein [bacterium]
MKKISYFLYILALATSCQNFSKYPNSNSGLSNEEYQAQIKADKKRQAEKDLPFRGFADDKPIQTIAFSAGLNSEPPEPLWATIEKNSPELMLLTTTPAPTKNLIKIPEYRSIREKVPFMAAWYNYDYNKKDDIKRDFVRSWPYAKNMIPESQQGFYHSKIFGTKKNLIHVIISDLQDSNDKTTQWNWLENEFKKPAALKILACNAEYREKLLALIKKTKTKNIILIPNDHPVFAMENTEIKDLGPIYAAPVTSEIRTISSHEPKLMNFGLIKINWAERVAQVEIRSIENQKIQGLDLKF